jgi:putative ABC transport system permease protein
MGCEIALTLILLVGSMLTLRSLSRLTSVDLGFDPDGMFTIEVAPLDDQESWTYQQYYVALLERLRQAPGVLSAGAIDALPLSGLQARAALQSSVDSRLRIAVREVLPGYFESMGIPVQSGRDVSLSDRSGTLYVALVNETAAGLLGGSSIIGQLVTLTNVPREIVGIVGDVRHEGQASNVSPEIYVPYLQGWIPPVMAGSRRASRLIVVVRPSRTVSLDVMAEARGLVQAVGPTVLSRGIRRGGDWLAASQATSRQRSILFGLFAGIALLLTAVGVSGVTGYASARRAQEIGVRLALGAQPRSIKMLVVMDTAAPLVVGLTVGVLGAAAVARLSRSLLFSVGPTDSIAFAVSVTGIAVLVMVAAWIPARHAAGTDPVVALRCE